MCEEQKNRKRKATDELRDYSRGFNIYLDEKIEKIADLKYRSICDMIDSAPEEEILIKTPWFEIFEELPYNEFLSKYFQIHFSSERISEIIGKIKGKIYEKFCIDELKDNKNIDNSSISNNIEYWKEENESEINTKIKEIVNEKYKFIYQKAVSVAVNSGEKKIVLSWFEIFDSVPLEKFLAKFFEKDFNKDEISEVIACIKIEIKDKLLGEGFEIDENNDGVQYMTIKW